MSTTPLQDLVDWLLGPAPAIRDATRVFGGGTLSPMPPNQALLTLASGPTDRVEIVAARDNDDTSPPRELRLILRTPWALTRGQLEQVFGLAAEEPEDGKPRPAALLRFAPVSRPAQGVDVLRFARVTRPGGRDDLVQSIQFVRVAYTPRP
ncbi:MAG: hypothetical protein ABJD97_07075 [Betaproteobacteria bacterium]